MYHRHPISSLFPYTTLFRSIGGHLAAQLDRVQLHARVDRPRPIRTEREAQRGAGGRLDGGAHLLEPGGHALGGEDGHRDRKSTRLNSSHSSISYAVFCLKKK